MSASCSPISAFVVGVMMGTGNFFLVLLHAFRQTHAADFAHAALIRPPCRAAEVAAHNHLQGEAFAEHAHGHHRVGRGQLPVGADVRRGVEELCGYLVQYLSLVGDAFGQDDVEGRDAVRSHHDEFLTVDVVHIAHFPVVD